MRKQALNLRVAAAVMGQGVAITTSAEAAHVINYQEVGADVIATGSGSLDVTDLKFVESDAAGTCSEIDPSQGFACTVDTYQGFAGPTSFGPGGIHVATSGSGDFTGIVPLAGNLHPPGGYTSGHSLFGGMTLANTNFQDLGLTPGTYVWSWGTGPDADTFTVQVGAPEPSTWALLLAGFGALGLVGWDRGTRKAEAIG